MPYEVNIQEQTDYLRVDVAGERIAGQEEADAILVWSCVAKACKTANLHRILVVLRLAGRLPASAAYAIGFNPERFGWSKRFKLAVVDESIESRQDAFFLEDVAVSSGYQIRVCDDEDGARTWLFES